MKYIYIILSIFFITSCSTTKNIDLEFGSYSTRGLFDNDYASGLTHNHVECMYIVIDDFVKNRKYIDYSNENLLSEVVQETYFGVIEGKSYSYYGGILMSQKSENEYIELLFFNLRRSQPSAVGVAVFTNPRSLLPNESPFIFLPARDGLLLYTNISDFARDESESAYGVTWDDCRDRHIELIIRDS